MWRKTVEQALREAIIGALHGSKNQRVQSRDLVQAARPLFKAGGYSDFEITGRILNTLNSLADDDIIRLPSKKGTKWDLVSGLPEYVTKIRNEAQNREREERLSLKAIKRSTGWEPTYMASFAHGLHGKAQLKRAHAVNQYLKRRVPTPPIVPHRERALQIFGDEKALDTYVQSGLFGGRIRLDHMDCFYCPEPLPYEPLSMNTAQTTDKPLLVVENACTYWSCCRANQDVRLFAAVVYGQGFKVTSVKRIIEGLPAIEAGLKAAGIVYFGDMDPAGLEIPKRIHYHRLQNGLSPLIPALPLYRALIEKGITTPYQRSQMKFHSQQWAIDWLGEEVGRQYLKHVKACRWPQEGLVMSDIVDALTNSTQKWSPGCRLDVLD
jgi:hypothetical protein